MIIWRGWGILGVGFFLITGILGIGVPYGLLGEAGKWLLIPVAIAAGVGCWFTGSHLNIVLPERYLTVELPRLRADIEAAVANGTFRLANQPPPRSLEEAQGQATTYLAFLAGSGKGMRNRHTLFWIPLQYWGFVILAWGIAMPLLLK